MPEHYIIVGRQLRQQGNVKYLHRGATDANGNELIDENDDDSAIPLTAEFIGEEIINLSEHGPISEDDPEYAAAVRRIKYALAVVPPDGHDAQDPELEEILENTQVKLVWEERKQENDKDHNLRTFVVPVPDTLARKRAELTGVPKREGFEPPLTYFLDVILMKAHLQKVINQILDTLVDNNGNAFTLPDGWREAFDDRFTKELGSYDELSQLATNPAEHRDANVLTDPVSAFHRAVGIYITNMCD